MEFLFILMSLGLLIGWFIYFIDDSPNYLNKNIIFTIAFVVTLVMWLSLTNITYDKIEVIHLDEVSYYTDKGQVQFVPSNVLYVKRQNPRWGSLNNHTYIYIYQE